MFFSAPKWGWGWHSQDLGAGSWRNKLKNLVILLWKSLCQGYHDLHIIKANDKSSVHISLELLAVLTALLTPLIEILFLMCFLCCPYILLLQSSLLGPPVFLREGNGTPLQLSCLENPRDRGAWWAAVSGVAQSRTLLKRLSSSLYSWFLKTRVPQGSIFGPFLFFIYT